MHALSIASTMFESRRRMIDLAIDASRQKNLTAQDDLRTAIERNRSKRIAPRKKSGNI